MENMVMGSVYNMDRMNTKAELPLSAQEVRVLLAILEYADCSKNGLSCFPQSWFYEKSDKKAGKCRFRAKNEKYVN